LLQGGEKLPAIVGKCLPVIAKLLENACQNHQ